jgi:hypothetical protein
MWLLLLLLLQTNAAPCPPSAVPTGTPSLVVQVVDPLWLPIPGAQVTVKPLSGKGRQESGRTDSDGYAKFWLEREAEYSVDVAATGFKNKRLKRLHIGKVSGSHDTAYVQLKLDLKGPSVTIY